MKFVSWNVNGLRACMGKGFEDIFRTFDADIFAVQETKMQEGQAQLNAGGYFQYWHSAEKKGYSGTLILAKQEPKSVSYGLGADAEQDREGRVITLEYPDFWFVNCYVPNSRDGLKRLDYRVEWDKAFRGCLSELNRQKPVIVCGDLNVAHREIDIKNPKTNRKNAGFTDEERHDMDLLLEIGLTDTYRHLNPDKEGAYSWWSYRFNARARNAGWRIDYFLVSAALEKNIKNAEIHADILGSDHCPVSLELDFE